MHHQHPAARYDRSVVELRTRATVAVIALGASMLVDLYDVAAREWSLSLLRTFSSSDAASQETLLPRLESADRLVEFGSFTEIGVLLLTAIVFLRWVHRLVMLTRSLGEVYLSWTPSQAVWAFFLPLISLVRPYRVLSEVQEKLDPDDIIPPAPHVDRGAQADYRTVAFVAPPVPRPIPRALLGLWWGCFVASHVVTRISNALVRNAEGADAIITSYHVAMIASALAIVAAALAIGVVRSLTARLDERFRRIRYSTPEALAEQLVLR